MENETSIGSTPVLLSDFMKELDRTLVAASMMANSLPATLGVMEMRIAKIEEHLFGKANRVLDSAAIQPAQRKISIRRKGVRIRGAKTMVQRALEILLESPGRAYRASHLASLITLAGEEFEKPVRKADMDRVANNLRNGLRNIQKKPNGNLPEGLELLYSRVDGSWVLRTKSDATE